MVGAPLAAVSDGGLDKQATDAFALPRFQYCQALEFKQPDVIGSGQMNQATYSQATQDGTKIVLVDGTFKDVPHFGVDDQQVGRLALDALAPAAKARMDGAWKGRKVDVVGMTAGNCTPCDIRVKAAFARAHGGSPAEGFLGGRLDRQGAAPGEGENTESTDELPELKT